jgi:aminopeptidase YwaD
VSAGCKDNGRPDFPALARKAEALLQHLCIDIPSRRVGSEGNRAATRLFAEAVRSFGFAVESHPFDCVDWYTDGATLRFHGRSVEAFPSPYSLGCQVQGRLVVVSSIEELEAADIRGRIAVLRGDLTKEQLMPLNFSFYNPDEHKRILRALEGGAPLAVIAVCSRDTSVVGSMYPFPLFEDGDFDVPSVFMTSEAAGDLIGATESEASLEIRARRIPSTGCNVIARKGADSARRVVLVAHIDARLGSPGAGDNASGVVVLLLLAELLADYAGDLGIEIVAMNGEDYYATPGELQYLAMNAGRFQEIVLGINVDGVGYRKGRGAYSTYGCPPEQIDAIRRSFSASSGLMEGPPWFQGDHGLFLMNQVPTLALTSELAQELTAEIIHTPKDLPETVDPDKLVEIAVALKSLVLNLAGSADPRA